MPSVPVSELETGDRATHVEADNVEGLGRRRYASLAVAPQRDGHVGRLPNSGSPPGLGDPALRAACWNASLESRKRVERPIFLQD